MTNKEEEDQIPNPIPVSTVAVNLVRQILEEACIIASTANDSGDPWEYISRFKNGKLQNESYRQNRTFIISNDNLGNYNHESPIVTSTPQKGQGDERFISGADDTAKSTSKFITQLFDMSEHVGADEFDSVDDHNESKKSLIEYVINNIIDLFVNASVCNVLPSENKNDDTRELYEESTFSSYLYLCDAKEFNDVNDVPLHFDDRNNTAAENDEEGEIDSTGNKNMNENIKLNNVIEDICSYENAYSSLNRDYEQYFDIQPMVQDPKGHSFHEINLRPEQAVNKDLMQPQYVTKSVELATTSKEATSVTDSRRRTLIRRCRLQGSKFFACFRSLWWRKKLFRKHKIPRVPGSVRGVCPLSRSPEARRRAASLTDQRHIDSHTSTWKFNTISEAFLHSSLWKDLGCKMNIKKMK